MKIAIIEDEGDKMRRLREVVFGTSPTATILEARSFSSGRKLVLNESPDLVLLDMSMPTFDVTLKDKGGRPRGFGGRDILDEVVRRGCRTRVVVVTGFDLFGEGDTRKTLRELDQELASRFPTAYLGTVSYNAALSDWQIELANHIREAIGEIDDKDTGSR